MFGVKEKYQGRLAFAEETIRAEDRRRGYFLLVFVLCITAVCGSVAVGHAFVACALLMAVLYTGIAAQRASARWLNAEREREYFQTGLARLNGGWRDFEQAGDEFRRTNHVYQDDLHVLGKGSLFQLLCTVRTHVGAERLASYLLEPTDREESLRRQAAVYELRDNADLREATNKLGKFNSQDCDRVDFEAWINLPILVISQPLQWFAALCSMGLLLLGTGVYSKLLSVMSVWPLFLVLALPPLGIAALFMKKIRERIGVLRRLVDSTRLLFEGAVLLEAQNFMSEKLKNLTMKFHDQSAKTHLRGLCRILEVLQQRDKPWFAFSALFALGTQIVFCAERWRKLHQEQLREWLDVWADFEALQAIAGFALEHPDYAFPDLCVGKAHFKAETLGHPLLQASECVRNDISLNAERYMVVSGSNMAGKSTLLRTVGLNAVLAYAGGPVCAERLSLTQMQVCTSISVQDSLGSARSKFMVEVERLAFAIERTQSGEQVLFLIDEILSGTNSADRRVVAEGFLREIQMGETVGILTSHDISLVEAIAGRGVLTRMETGNIDDPLCFDFLLKPGLARVSSAVAIAKMVGMKGCLP